jgi:hypothetical protein
MNLAGTAKHLFSVWITWILKPTLAITEIMNFRDFLSQLVIMFMVYNMGLTLTHTQTRFFHPNRSKNEDRAIRSLQMIIWLFKRCSG